MTKTERIENLIKKLKTRKSKNIIYLIVVVIVTLCFAYRFQVVAQERNSDVFNIARNNLQNGLPVSVLKMKKTDGILYEPITIKNNRAYVSGGRIGLFKSGQKIGDCKIVYVSHGLDLDTGTFVIKTSKCDDGLKYAEIKKYGFYIPVSAVFGDTVFVADGDVARVRKIVVGGRDAQNVLIESGINDGDIVILSSVSDNQKIRITK